MSIPSVTAVSQAPSHTFSKSVVGAITLVAGLGVQNDAHAGATVKHTSLAAHDPSSPNLRQVHLIPYELLYELKGKGFDITYGQPRRQLGENITTHGLDLAALPRGTRLHFPAGGGGAVVELTGLRQPGPGIERFKPGLLQQVCYQARDGRVVRRAGVMGVVVAGGCVRAGDGVLVAMPALPHVGLGPV
ncbi:PK beta-barrel-protein domain-containing protein-like protein [Mytilinidion resinicola]|uniref:PK beta-barrel-protein domain-containing protein-like protein n=1 Tax=Mytilinidion resinicola TaxID=574789 RepID=A0A6A6Y3J7_9PEZI|nr:PK beta-barrel-protein domain-containing protein-like protein [Mytilinidion resinicola]KAF2803230.1 PK beta-barrel-protein domain-containing protein-like protein [Mytilinidion resinicola]